MDSTASRFTSTLMHALGAQSGDGLSWSRLEAKVRPWIEGRLSGEALPPAVDADDVLQAVLFELFRTFDGIELTSRDSFKSWVLRVTDHKVTDLWRRARARKRGEGRQVPGDGDDGVAEVEDPAAGPSTIARRSELEQRVETAMARLGRGDRKILHLREVEGLSYAEIAARWDYDKEETIRKRYFRARKRRREILDHLASTLLDTSQGAG